MEKEITLEQYEALARSLNFYFYTSDYSMDAHLLPYECSYGEEDNEYYDENHIDDSIIGFRKGEVNSTSQYNSIIVYDKEYDMRYRYYEISEPLMKHIEKKIKQVIHDVQERRKRLINNL